MFPRKQTVCRAVLLTLLFTTTFLTFITFDPGGRTVEAGGTGGGGGVTPPDERQGRGWVENIQVKTVLMPKKCEVARPAGQS